MSVLGWILFGFVVGLIARVLMPGRDPLGLIGTTVLGIVGALCAGWVGQALGFYAPGDGAGFVAATLGAIVVLSIYYGSYGSAAKKRLRAARGMSQESQESQPPRTEPTHEIPAQRLFEPERPETSGNKPRKSA